MTNSPEDQNILKCSICPSFLVLSEAVLQMFPECPSYKRTGAKTRYTACGRMECPSYKRTGAKTRYTACGRMITDACQDEQRKQEQHQKKKKKPKQQVSVIQAAQVTVTQAALQDPTAAIVQAVTSNLI